MVVYEWKRQSSHRNFGYESFQKLFRLKIGFCRLWCKVNKNGRYFMSKKYNCLIRISIVQVNKVQPTYPRHFRSSSPSMTGLSRWIFWNNLSIMSAHLKWAKLTKAITEYIKRTSEILSHKTSGEIRKTWRIDHLFTINLQYRHLLVIRPLDLLFVDGVNLHYFVRNFVIIQESWKEIKLVRK